jgi:hypothetical protein
MGRTIFAACIASVVALIGFLTLHAIVIVPIWWSVLEGLPFVMIASLAIAPAFHRLVRGLWGGLLFGAALWCCLVGPALLKPITTNDVVAVVVAAVTAIALSLFVRRDRLSIAAAALAGGTFIVAAHGPLSIFKSARALHLFWGLLPVCAIYGLAIALISRAASEGFLRRPFDAARSFFADRVRRFRSSA